jgi:hypothetical protein
MLIFNALYIVKMLYFLLLDNVVFHKWKLSWISIKKNGENFRIFFGVHLQYRYFTIAWLFKLFEKTTGALLSAVVINRNKVVTDVFFMRGDRKYVHNEHYSES